MQQTMDASDAQDIEKAAGVKPTLRADEERLATRTTAAEVAMPKDDDKSLDALLLGSGNGKDDDHKEHEKMKSDDMNLNDSSSKHGSDSEHGDSDKNTLMEPSPKSDDDSMPKIVIPPPAPEEDDTSAQGGVLRWLWWVMIAYMFYAQASVCDEYFVESISVCCEKYSILDDVAGATLMALGCNGPELFSNCIAIFVYGGSDVGVSTIVGSEIFNYLCIIGGAIVINPEPFLQLNKVPFMRDSAFYFVSIILLGWTLFDGQVSPFESTVLVFFCVVFVLSVSFTSTILKQLGYNSALEKVDGSGNPLAAPLLNNGAANGAAASAVENGAVNANASSPMKSGPIKPGEAIVKVHYHNRLMDAKSERFRAELTAGADGLYVKGNNVDVASRLNLSILPNTDIAPIER